MYGNLGAILFRSADGTVLGHNWVAASSKLRKTARAQAFSRGDVVINYHGLAKLALWSAPKQSTIVNAPLAATDPAHKNDTEHVLLNALHSRLRSCGLRAPNKTSIAALQLLAVQAYCLRRCALL